MLILLRSRHHRCRRCVLHLLYIDDGGFFGSTDVQLGATFGVAVVATLVAMFVAGVLVMFARAAGDGLFYSCVRDCMSMNRPYPAAGGRGGPAPPAPDGAAQPLPPPAQAPQAAAAAAAPQAVAAPPSSGVAAVAPPAPATVTAAS